MPDAVETPAPGSEAQSAAHRSDPVRRRRLGAVVGRLASVNFFIVGLTFITAPLQARALGPAGRGDLAAILVPLGLAPVIVSLGLGTYSSRQAARGRPLAPLVGTVGAMLLVLGALAALASPLIADLFSEGRDVVETWIVVGFLLLPLGLISWLLTDLAIGRERWGTVIAVRLIPPLTTVICVGTLVLFDRLTVATAAATAVLSGALPALVLLPQLRGIGRPRFSREVAREAVPFGFKAWLGGLGNVANVRLDQLLMIRLVESQELGLYAVAFSVAGILVTPVVSALASGSMPRFATGDVALIARVLRITIVGVAVTSVGVALFAPFAIPFVFGDAFADAIPMVWVLLAAGIPLAGVTILSTALTSKGRPGFSASSELLTLSLTVPGLFLLLPVMGGVGAAVVSLVAYTAGLTLLMFGARRHLGASWKDLLVVRGEDLDALRGMVSARVKRLRDRRSKPADWSG